MKFKKATKAKHSSLNFRKSFRTGSVKHVNNTKVQCECGKWNKNGEDCKHE